MRRLTFWAVALAVVVIVVFNVQGWLVLSRTSRVFEQELGDRMQAIATTLSQALAGRWQEPGAERLMHSVMRDNGLFNLFVVNERLQYRLNLASPDRVGSADPALELDIAEVLSALSGIPSQSRVYRAGDLYLKSAYAPLVDSSGTIGAVLGVEADAGFFSTLTGFRNSLLLINILSLVAISAVVLVSVSLARHALRVEQAAARANTLALMGQMSAAVAHEIKNPLAIIRSTAERLKKQYGADAGDPKFDYIQDEVDRLSQVVSNYLGIGRSRPGELEPVDVGRLVREVATDVAAQAQRTGVDVSAEAADGLPPVRGSRNELRQVLLNLVLNGVQAQPGGGRVRVEALEVRSQKSDGGKLRAGDRSHIVVRVKDDGPGVDARTAKRMFEPFFTTREKGSGLGLFVVRRIVEEHRGRVRLANPGEPGAEVEIVLPAEAK